MLLGILKTHSVQNGAVVIECEWNVHAHTHTHSKYYNMLSTLRACSSFAGTDAWIHAMLLWLASSRN